MYEGKPILNRCLGTLAETDYGNLEVVLADASSSDDSVQFVQNNFTGTEIVLTKNIGYAHANNRAIEFAFERFPTLRYVLLLNNDLIFNEPFWLRRLVSVADSSNRIGIVGCELRYPNGSVQHGGGRFDKFGRLLPPGEGLRSGCVDYVTGAVFLVKREVLERIGLFDEVYCPIYWDETDFCARARKQGYLVHFEAGTKIIHLESHTTRGRVLEAGWKRETVYSLSHRNKYIYLLRWGRRIAILHFLIKGLSLIESPSAISASANGLDRGMSARAKAMAEIRALVNASRLYKRQAVPHLD